VEFTDAHGEVQRLHPQNDINIQHCEYKHTILPMAWVISNNVAARRSLVDSHLRNGQDFTDDFPLADWLVSCKANQLPNLLLTLLLFLDEIA
jgi:hypothetical protein